jgi:hypothetical protein
LKQVMKSAARIVVSGGTLSAAVGHTTCRTRGSLRLLQAFATILRRSLGVGVSPSGRGGITER